MSGPHTFLIGLLYLVGIYAIIVMLVKAVLEARERRLRHDTYHKLIASGALDRETLEEILRSLGAKSAGRKHANQQGRFPFYLGWLGIFLGGALLASGALVGQTPTMGAGTMILGTSLGLATLPIAWREVQRRTPRSDPSPGADRREAAS